MRFVLQTVRTPVKPAAPKAKQAAPTPAVPTASQPKPQTTKQSITASKQPIITTATIITPAPSTAVAPSKPVVLTLPTTAPTAVPAAPFEAEAKEAVDEVRLRFDPTYDDAADGSRRDEADSELEDQQEDEYSDEEDEEANLGAPSVAINCSYSINPTSALQRSMQQSQADEGSDEEGIEEEDEACDEQQHGQNDGENDDEEAKQQYEEADEQQQEEAVEDEMDQEEEEEEDEEEEEEETELHHFVAVDQSVTHIVHSKAAGVESKRFDSDDEAEDQDESLDDTLQLHAFQPHAIHIQSLPHNEEKDEEQEQVSEESEEKECADEEEDDVSDLCTVQIHQQSLVTQGTSQSHWQAVNTPTRAPYYNNNDAQPSSTPSPNTQTASFTLNDSADDILPTYADDTTHTPSKAEQVTLTQQAGGLEWDEETHEARVRALQVELKERVEARRRKLRRASYMEEMEEKRLQKELEAKQRALTKLRLLRVKQEAEAQLAALTAQKQREADEREKKERKDKENQHTTATTTQQQQQLKKRQSTDSNNNTKQPQPAAHHTRTPSSLVMRQRIKQAHYDRLLKAVERGDSFTKYYDSWYRKPKTKFVRVVSLGSQGGQSSTMKLTWGSDMFNMSKAIDLSSVVKVQRGSESAVAAKLPVELHARAFSVVTSDGKSLHLVAPTQATRELWLSFVLLVVESRRQPLGELNGVAGLSEVKVSDDTSKASSAGVGGTVGERVRRSMGGRLSAGRLSLGRLSLGGGGKNAVNQAS